MRKAVRLLLAGSAVAWLPLLRARAQSVGIGTTTPNAAAALDITAPGKGLLIPRLDSAARVAIAAPPTGLLVFQMGTTTPRTRTGFYYYGGTGGWLFLPDKARGGDNLGTHVATQNLSLGTNALMGTGADLGTAVGVGVRADGGLNIGQNTTGNNISVGYLAGRATTTGRNNQFIGFGSGAATTVGSGNQFTGFGSGFNNTSGNYNLFSGPNSGANTTTGSSNVFVGYLSGLNNSTGSSNTALGANSGPDINKVIENATALGANVSLTQSNTVVLGNNANVGIGTSDPNQKLQVVGQVYSSGSTGGFRFPDNSVQTTAMTDAQQLTLSGQVLSLTRGGSVTLPAATGTATVAAGPGLSSTTSGGTTTVQLGGSALTAATNVPLAGNALTFSGAGSVGIGTSAPAYTLDVAGTTRTTNALVTTALTGSGATIGSVVGLGVRADGGLNIGQNTIGKNVAVGYQAGAVATGTANLFVGYLSGAATTSGNYNVFTGYRSGAANTTGTSNVFVGLQSGQANTTGNDNVFVGTNSGPAATTGNYNVFTGSNSGFSNTTGSNNVFSGYRAGFANTEGTSNVFVGLQSGGANTTGNNNVFGGYLSGAGNTTGANNVYVGYQSGGLGQTGSNNTFSGFQSGINNTGSDNVFAGANSGLSNTSGYGNVFSGSGSGRANTTGYGNVFTGTNSGQANTTGNGNVFTGTNSGQANTTGNSNVFAGVESGKANSTGSGNTFNGTSSGLRNTTGSNNVFGGFGSGQNNTTGSTNVFIGSASGINNTEGTNNVYVGYQSGFFGTTGNNNTILGTNSGPNSGVVVSNATAVGSYVTLAQDNTIVLGNQGQSVGIGTSTPSQQLELAGASQPTLLLHSPFNGKLNSTMLQFRENNLSYGWNLRHNSGDTEGGTNNDRLVLERLTGGSPAPVMTWDQNTGFVGVGTTAPGVPLDIAGGQGLGSSATYGYYSATGYGTGYTATLNNVSLRASGRIVAQEFNASSDARLKRVLGFSNGAADLALLRQVRITDYQLRDSLRYGPRRFKKVIAQQIEQVFPQAVSQLPGFLPDVYARAQASGTPADSLRTLALPAGLASAGRVGQRLRLLGPQGEVVATLASPAAAGSRTLRVRGAGPLAAGEVFVFGFEHPDVRAVDYEALAMLGVSATQELARRVEALEAQNAALRQQQQATSAAQQADHASLETLQAELARLRAAVLPEAQARR